MRVCGVGENLLGSLAARPMLNVCAICLDQLPPYNENPALVSK
jgi:hypothetical protein